MFRFLGTKEEEVPIERDTIDESDEETLFDSGEENVGIQIKNSMEYGDMTAGYIRTDELLQISSWVYNRSLDKKRVAELRKEILKTGHPFGVFTLVELDDEYYLIDGQHRQVALSRAIKKEPELVDCPIIVMSFRVESDVEAVELFRKVNNTRPLEPRDTPNTIIITVIDKLAKHFKRAIKKDQTRTCYPYIVADELHKKLREIELEGVTPEKLYKAILALNSEYRKKASADGIRAIPGIRGAQTLKKQSVEKAKQSGFYLGLDEKWFWLQDLEEML